MTLPIYGKRAARRVAHTVITPTIEDDAHAYDDPHRHHIEASMFVHEMYSEWLDRHHGHHVFVAWIDPRRLICDECVTDDEWPLP